MNTWLADFIEKTDLNRYPVALRTRGGIGFQVGTQVISNFVGHPVHYRDGQEWKPITLRHENGQFEGSRFGWNGFAVTFRKRVLFQPESITFNGVVRPLKFFREENRMVAYVPKIGTYEIIFSERGVRELLTIPEPLEGVLSFQVNHTEKPREMHKHPRRLMGVDGIEGDVYTLTKDMNYPLEIDPDYSGTTGDGYVLGNQFSYATARSTSSSFNITNTTMLCGQTFVGTYEVDRAFLKMDTSGIPDGDTISQVNLNLACTTDNSTTNFDVVIRKQDWSGQDPIGAGNREAAFDGCLSASSDDNIWRNTSGMSTNTLYASGNLATAYVSKTGYTYYSLLSSRDVSNTTPTGAEYIALATQDHGTSGYRPVLTVVHAAAATRKSLALLGVG